MGLAASQARFLAITSRKAYCEFESMQLAQEKLSITRDMAEISEKYQNALNQTTLVWDYDGSGENPYNLTYDLLMTPSVLNDYNPYLITTRTGSVVLTGALASAAAAISPNGSPVERSEAGFQAFIDKLKSQGILTESDAEYMGNDEIYDKNIGYGSQPLRDNINYINDINGLAYRLSQSYVSDDTETRNLFSTALPGNVSTDKTAADSDKILVNGNLIDTNTKNSLMVGDLLKSDIVYIHTLPDNNTSPSDESIITTFKENVTKILDEIVQGIQSVFPNDLATETAINTAKILVEGNYINNTIVGRNDEAIRSTETAFSNAVNNASANNAIGYGNAKGNKHNDSIAINLSNMMAAFLTYFELSLNGYNSNYNVGATTSTSYYVTDDPYYNYLIGDDEEGASDISMADTTLAMRTDFYMQLYNNICINGWTRNDGVEDEKYLDNALKNGTYFITSLNNDGYFYQGRYNESDCIVEITDTDAIAQAEAEFNTAKVKLTYKEDQIDLNMKNLDTEISSLTTEYDSVKNLISKNVEKVFSMFQ